MPIQDCVIDLLLNPTVLAALAKLEEDLHHVSDTEDDGTSASDASDDVWLDAKWVQYPPLKMFTIPDIQKPDDIMTKKEYRRRIAIPRYLKKRERRVWTKGPMYPTRTQAALKRKRADAGGRFARDQKRYFRPAQFR